MRNDIFIIFSQYFYNKFLNSKLLLIVIIGANNNLIALLVLVLFWSLNFEIFRFQIGIFVYPHD